MAVTQKQIAEKLNVSRALVGRALSGADEVSEAMRERVLEVAQEMGYSAHSNQVARSLIARRYGQRAKTGIIAVTFPALNVASPRHIPFFSPVLEGMESEAASHGLDLCLCLIRDGETPRLLREGGVDGIVTLTTRYRDMEAMSVHDLPIISFQAIVDNAHGVAGDDREGGYLATKYLIEQGHRDIAFMGVHLGDNGDRIVRLRYQGYLNALGEFGIPLHEQWTDFSLPLPTTTSSQYCSGCGKCAACIGWDVLKQKSGKGRPAFTGIVCHNDNVAMGMVEGMQKDGLIIPDDISVVGFDASHEYDFHPEITSISYPHFEMGRRAVQLLHEILEARDQGNEPQQPQHRLYPASLVIRESVASLSHSLLTK